MKEKTKIINLFQLWGIVFIVSFSVIITLSMAYYEYQSYKSQSEQLRNNYVNQQKYMIKNQVKNVVDRINNERKLVEKAAQDQVKNEVYDAYKIAENIYSKYKATKSKSEIIEIIMEALRPIRFNGQNGYIFSIDLKGKSLLYPTIPSLENTNVLQIQDTKGKYVVKEESKVCREKGEGFVIGYWPKPSYDKKTGFKKISYIKHFKPYNFYFGAGVYVNDVEERVQNDLLEDIGNIHFGPQKDGYIFVVSYEGTTLMNRTQSHLIGKNIWDLTDPNGVKVLQEERKAVDNPDGDFIYYSWNKPSSKKVSPKTSFVKGIKKWKWMIGAGVYLDDVEIEINDMYIEFRNKEIKNAILILLIMIITIFLFIYFLKRLKDKMNNDFEQFNLFLKKAAFSNKLIDISKIKYKEFEALAKNANQMLEDKKKIKQEILNEKERLFVTIRSIGDGVIITDNEGKIVSLNNIAEKMTGWKTQEAKGKNLSEVFNIFNSITRAKPENPVDKVLQTGKIVGLANHTVLVSKNKEELQIADSAAPIKDNDDNILGVVLVFRDVTEEYKNKAILEKALEQTNLVLQSVNLGWWDWDVLSGNMEYNEILPQLLGWKLSEMTLDINWWKGNIHPDDLEQDLIVQQKHFDGKTEFYINEYRVKTKEGKWKWFLDYGKVVDRDESGKPLRMIGTLRDIDKQKSHEQELQKMDKLTSIGTLAGGIAHDFNNILTGVYGNITLAQMKLDSKHPSFSNLENAAKSLNRATKLTRQLLTFSKGGAPVKEDVKLSEVIKETITFDLSGSNLKPVFDFEENHWNAYADKGQMQQVFSNLAINANQATPDGGHFFVEMKNISILGDEITDLEKGVYLQISVRDEGIGIEQKNIDKIFDPYFTTKETGSGLGLATTYSIIKKHHGHLEIESELNVGTKFTIYLPAIKPEEVILKVQKDVTATKNRQTAKILIMDDDEAILTITSSMLELLNYEVETANGGAQAIEKYNKSLKDGRPFDIIIMDLTIPGGMGGEVAVKKILEIDDTAKIIVSSGYENSSVMSNYKDFGFEDVIVKPFTIESLGEVLSRVLD